MLLVVCLFSGILHSQVVFQSNNTSGCTPMGVVISVSSPAASSITSYSWHITTPTGTVLTATSAQYIAIFSQPGLYDVSLTINGNQTTTMNDYISVHALPTANFIVSDAAGCFPLCVDFSDVSVEGSGNIVEWSWDFGDGGSSSDQNPNYCYNQVGNFTPVFSIEDEFGCFADITMASSIQVVNNFPTAQFALSSQLDCNPPVDISMTNTSVGNSALTSEWDFGDGNTQTIAGTTAATHNFQTTGTFNVCLTVTDQIGCEDQECHTLEIFGTPTAQFNVSDISVCEGENISFTSTTTPTPLSVDWDFNGDGVTDSNNPNPSYTYLNSGNYSPSLSVHYSGDCNDTESGAYNITVIDGTTVDFVGDTLEACAFPFTVHFDNLSTGQGMINYEWFVDGVSAGSTTDLTYTFNTYGNFDIKLVATNAQGCINEKILTDYVLVQAPTVQFNHGVSVCTEQNVPVNNIVVNSVDPVASYLWDFNSDGITDATGITPTFTYSTPGIYTITLTIETLTGCTATYTSPLEINVLVNVDAEFTASADTTCAGSPVEFCVVNQPGNTYSWNFYDGSGWVIMPLNENCLIHDYPDTGWYDLTLTVFNGACNVMETFENYIYVEPPVALFEYQVACGNLSAEFADISIGADSIVWDFGDGSILSDVANPTHDFDTSGVYTVTLTAYANGSDCPDTHSAEIVVSDPVTTMTFSPNVGCPPLVTQFGSAYYYPHWDVTVSNGDHINVDWNTTTEHWTVLHTFDGGSETFSYSNPDQFYWPEVVFNDGGFYDVSVTVIDNNGCSATEVYEDVIQVSANPNFASFSTTNIDICTSVDLQFVPDLPDLTSWQWIFSDGSVSTSENPVHTFHPPYNYNQPLSATLTAVDTLGCTSSVTQQINVTFPPMVDFIAASDPSCVGDDVQFINYSEGPTGTTYFWDFGDPTSADNTSTLEEPSHAFDANGNYEVCLSADNQAGCIVTSCSTGAVHISNPEVTFTYNSSINNCLYGVQFQNTTPGNVVSSQWEFGDDQSGFGMMAYHTYPIGVYDVTLIVTNGYGCVDSLVVPDILNYGNQVGPYTQLLDSADCAPFEVSFGAFNPNDTYFTYFWDFNDGFGDPSGNTVTNHTYTQPGTYCPSIIMTDPNGCPVLVSCTDSIVVDEFVLEYSLPAYICFGDTLNLNIGNGSSYVWDDMSQITVGSSPNEFLLHPSDDSQFVLTGYYADCVRTDTFVVVVNDLPIVTLDLPESSCYGDTVMTLNSGLPNNPPGTYFVDGTLSAVFDPGSTPDHNYEIRYQYVDTFQCVNSATAFVYLHSLPVVDFPAMPDLCENTGPINLGTATPTGGIYLLNNDTLINFDPSIGFGNYDLHYQFTDSNGCVGIDTSEITVNPIPRIDLSYTEECVDNGALITNNSTIPAGSITTTAWDFGVAGTDSNFQPTPHYFPTFGVFPLHVEMQSDAGCLNQLDSTLVMHAVPMVFFTPAEACQNENVEFVDHSVIAADSISNWIWNAEGQSFSSNDTLSYSFVGWGELPVSLTVVSNFGCDDTLTNIVSVHPAPVVSVTSTDGCYGIESQFHADTSIPAGGVVSQIWTFGDGNTESGSDADNLYANTGVYSLVFEAESNLGCVTSVNDTITIYERPEADFTTDQDHLCMGENYSLIDLSSTDALSQINSWTWLRDGELMSNSQNPDMISDQAGSFDITLVVIDNHGCTDDSTIANLFTVYPSPSAGFSTSGDADASDPSVTVFNTASEDVTQWYYDFGDDLSESFRQGLHTYQGPGVYEITQYVWNTFGCTDIATNTVEIRDEMLVFVPTAFTPDGNGNNEVFLPSISGFNLTLYHFRVFDRWGIEVFSTDDPTKGWDGTFHGGPAQDGNYTWNMDLKNGGEVTIRRKFGTVTLLR